jgi:cellulose synthase/poly-beta-1,6-N-acetylglucosamine synthase-like glycosyltransferase
LICGIFYFLCIPAGYLFLIIYAICNLHDISWGTREKEKAVLNHQNKQSLAVETDEKLRVASKQIMKDILNQAITL